MNHENTLDNFILSPQQKNLVPNVSLIISGGNTGADRAGLEAAVELGIPTGGTIVYGFKTSRGPDLALRDKFHLKEMELVSHLSLGAQFAIRSQKNVDNADGTIAFRLYSSTGTDRTIQYCLTKRWGPWTHQQETRYKPILIITQLDEKVIDDTADRIRKFLCANHIKTLNIAGHRKSPPDLPDFAHRVQKVLVKALTTNTA